MSESADERTIEATPRRRLEARREGRVARSTALSSTIILVGSLLVLTTFGGRAADVIGDLFRQQLGGQAALSTNKEATAAHWQHVLSSLLLALLPVMAGFVAVAVLANIVQTGLMYVPKNVAPDLSRINPWKNVHRLFSSSNVMSVVIGLLQLVVVGLIVWWVLRTDLRPILALSAKSPEQIVEAAGSILFSASLKVGLGLFATALLDYAYRRWSFERELQMTPQQQRDEARLSEGDPQFSSRRRQLHAGYVRGTAPSSADAVERLDTKTLS